MINDNENENNIIHYKSIPPLTLDHIDNYSKDEILLNNLCNVFFEMVPNQLFVNNFLSLNKYQNSLLINHNNDYDKVSSIITISEEMRETFLFQKKYIYIIASTNEIKKIQSHLFDEIKLKQDENGEWNIKECLFYTFSIQFMSELQSISSKEEIILQIKKKIDLYYKFFNYNEFTLYIENCIMGNSLSLPKKKIQIMNIQRFFNDCLLIIDQIDLLRNNEETMEMMIKIIDYSENLRLLLLSSTNNPIYNNIDDIVWITNFLRKNDKKSIIDENDIFDKKKQQFIQPSLLSKNQCGRSLLKQNLFGYVSCISKVNLLQFPFHIYQVSHVLEQSVKRIDNEKIDYSFQFIQPYLTKIINYQENHYLQSIDCLVKKKKNLFSSPSFDEIYKILQEPLQLLNITYLSNSEENVVENQHIGSIGFSNNISHIKDIRGKINYEYKYEIENFSRKEINSYSSKIAEICKNMINSEGTIMIYSQFIYSGILPMVLALEEMGYSHYNDNNVPFSFNIKKKKSVSLSNHGSYITITGDKTFSLDNKNEIDAFNRIDNIDGNKIKIILITKSGFQCNRRYNNIRQIHFMEPENNFEKIINSIDSFLPIKQRNIEIYLHASSIEKRVEEECVDLSLYRIMDKERSKMDEIHEFLSECSFECLFQIKGSELSIDELSESIENKKINIELSSNKILVPYQFPCNFFTKNRATIYHFIETSNEKKKKVKNEITEINEKKKRNDNSHKDKIEKIIHQLFKEKNCYDRKTIIELINQKRPYPLEEIYSTLKLLTNKENIVFLTDQYGRKGYIKKQENNYLFHPIINEKGNENENENATVNENIQKNKFIFIEKEQTKIKTEETINYYDIVTRIQIEMNIIFSKKTNGTKKKVFSFSSESNKIMERLINAHQISFDNLRKHFFTHYLDNLNLNEKMIIVKKIYTEDEKLLLLKRKEDMKKVVNDNNNNNNVCLLFGYFDELIFLKSTILYIVLYDGIKNIVYNMMNWIRCEENIKIPILNKNKLNRLYIGFYDFHDDGDDDVFVFKIKDRLDNRMLSFVVEKTGIKKILVVLNSLQNQLTRIQTNSPKVIIYSEENMIRNRLTKYQLIIMMEIIMREISFISSIRSFLSVEEAMNVLTKGS